ncbi:hypothetical protein PV10_03663 [Exophiala mesophila]|uniref:Parasitic phase-specific protein PSP-1 n=1 Tax=Exophiala mesophila TaxID=212818 RepID=A0A0D2AAZ6_EXOME|nr:uncharacterized protein PV10_03663 [Exophiala mesophila]KIV96083.1 hypothetical protein PV10_03663 [Exophiala mesophila]
MSVPNNLIAFGPDANCTLDLCPIEATVYHYRPSLPANAVFIALFAICMSVHLFQGCYYRTWTYSINNAVGCITEIIGYSGRIIMYMNPFSFTGFMMQICCITFAPVFFCAAIYITLTKIVNHLGPKYSRLPPKAYYWIFLPCDIVSLALQGAGGGLSTDSSGSSQIGVNVALAGLSFQVVTLTCFSGLCIDYAIRYYRSKDVAKTPVTRPFKVFAIFLAIAILLILARCIFRVDELSEGYSGHLIRNEGLFIGMEGVLIILAAFALNGSQPGPAFGAQGMLTQADNADVEKLATNDNSEHIKVGDGQPGR